ncbi:hypothetical protein [Shinella pollutisoli]|uniref:Uncharacterized protein n=1 Tax=Shinella pollutisoli TaxID=2250594 RepID=A0ABV7DA06_9HYPH|nr:hypothetical protein [Shinella pollutisoli]
MTVALCLFARLVCGLAVVAALVIALAILPALALVLAVPIQPARAHDAPSGWSYPFACCSNDDCRPVAETAVGEGPAGYVVRATGEVVPYADPRVRASPDGDFHWCSVAGEATSRTICLFVPPRAF